ncbi:hypothetical protein CRE_14497 [Caenorhabditis remanei]|uniref:BTB domain-containing protein n=1 Tax=Caenorhabditis remanei TaxID=31234 RepID=E3M980_CAERE|nr:hypothetical protein CRE_14497 [Caenorhabditis remanei]
MNDTLSEWTIEKFLDMRKEVLDKQKDLEKSNSEIVKKIENLSNEQNEKFDSIQSKLNEIVETLKPEVASKMEENNDSAVILAPVDSTRDVQKNEEMMSTSGKYFVLKHTFNNVSSIRTGTHYYSEEEEHFGVRWQIRAERNKDFLSFWLWSLYYKKTEKNWKIEVELEPKIVSLGSSGKKEKRRRKCSIVFQSDPMKYSWRCFKFVEWDELEKEFVVDDCFCAEIAIKVKKMTGIYKENLRSFDNSMKECSDVVLIVNDEKFYVSKLYLATHSSYFKTLFLGKFNEAKKTEIKLFGIDEDDFQNYLEVLYGEQAIDDYTVEGILMVADMYDTSLVIQKCESFLLKESNKTLKKKLQLSTRYNLPALMKQCLGEIKSVADIKSVLPGDIHDLDPSIMAVFLQRALSLHNS